MAALLQRLNEPLYEGSALPGWAAVAAALLLLAGLLLLLRRPRRRAGHGAERRMPPRTAPPPATQEPGGEHAFPAGGAIAGAEAAGISVANLQGLGMREEQQDAFAFSPLARYEEDGLLAVLCDGMGGMQAGSDIARMTISRVLSSWRTNAWACGPGDPGGPGGPESGARALRDINAEVYAQYAGQGGATLVAAYLCGARLWFWCVGDSDLFLYREAHLYALNARHEYRNELLLQALYGHIPLEEALDDPQGAALSQYIGRERAQCDYTRRPFPLREGDRLLLCSDGVSDPLPLSDIAACMALPPQQCCEALERRIQTERLPDQDNYTAIVIHINTMFGGQQHGNHA